MPRCLTGGLNLDLVCMITRIGLCNAVRGDAFIETMSFILILKTIRTIITESKASWTAKARTESRKTDVIININQKFGKPHQISCSMVCA